MQKVTVEILINTDQYQEAAGQDAGDFAQETVFALVHDLRHDTDGIAITGATTLDDHEVQVWRSEHPDHSR